MFVAWRDLRFARGRFVLIGSVVALITLLVGFLSGLTGGLASRSVSAVLALPADQIVLAADGSGSQAPGFSDSEVDPKQESRWRDADGVDSLRPIGLAQTRVESGSERTAVAVLGGAPDLLPDARPASGGVGLSSSAADELGVGVGDRVSIAGMHYRVASVGGDLWFSHLPLVRMTMGDWRGLESRLGSPHAHASALLVRGSPDVAALDEAAGTSAASPLGSLGAVGSFRSEIGSLLMMVALLFGISALVIGAFFTVWTLQRKADIAVLKALGAPDRALLADALGQALVVLVAGTVVGMGIVTAFGLALGGALPFLLSPVTTLVPAALMVLLGLAGAAFALRSVTKADPLTALGSTR